LGLLRTKAKLCAAQDFASLPVETMAPEDAVKQSAALFARLQAEASSDPALRMLLEVR
jgi:hypothetical protein